jgi:hypothetical protein
LLGRCLDERGGLQGGAEAVYFEAPQEGEANAAAHPGCQIEGGEEGWQVTTFPSPCYVFDVDGTLADSSHATPHIEKDQPDWDAFYDVLPYSKPIPHMVELVNSLAKLKNIVFATARSEAARDTTRLWLFQHVGAWTTVSKLYMRPHDDYREAPLIRLDQLAAMRRESYHPVLAFDDKAAVVQAWREAGVPCMHVCEEGRYS